MKKIFIAGIVFMTVPFATFAHTSATTAVSTTDTTFVKPGLLPGDLLYFLDRWAEALNMAITINSEKKARKHLEYALERVAEVDEVLKNPQARLENIEKAKVNFEERVAKVAGLIKEEKNKGADVANIARELDDKLDAGKERIRVALMEHEYASSVAEAGIRAKLTNLSVDDPQFNGLTHALESITKEKSDTTKELDDLDDDLGDEQALFEEVMGKELSEIKRKEQNENRIRENAIRDMETPEIDMDGMDIDGDDMDDPEDIIKLKEVRE